MASDYTTSKDGWGAPYHDNQVDSGWADCEPLLTPTQLRARHLFGVPIVSAIKNPFTGKPDIITDDMLAELIKEAAAIAELEGGFDIFPRRYDERHEYDQAQMQSFGYFRLRHFPAVSVEKLAVTSSDEVNVWEIPPAWIDTGYLHQGQINIVPFAVAAQSGTTVPVVGPTALGLIPSIFKFHWVPGLWKITYSTGFPRGQIPRIVNQLIGVVAAMEVLSMLATTYARSQSSSLGIDGLSQSLSTPGPNLFQARLEDLGNKRKWLIRKLKHNLGLGIITGTV